KMRTGKPFYFVQIATILAKRRTIRPINRKRQTSSEMFVFILKYIIFGEAKYVKDTNAYGKAMKQVDKFITEERDKSDLLDIRDFVTKESLNNAALGSRAFACGFSSTKIDDDTLISNITKNKYFQTLSQHIEVIYIAINTF
ncbi:hypothetical protein ACTGXX_11050, partial [Streptococcus suis]